MDRTILGIFMLLAALLAGHAAADRPVTVSAEVVRAEPGRTTLLWTFDLAGDWHLYGPHRNDSGQPPTVAWDLPDGWSAAPLTGWPRPRRHVVADLILDHVYERRLVLSQTLTHPSGSARRALEASLRWLVCDEMCVPGDTVITVSVPEAPAADAAARWRRHVAATPGPLPADRFTVERGAETIAFSVPGAARLEFVPDARGPRLADLVADGAAAGPRLVLRLAAPARRDTLSGLLIIDHNNGDTSLGTVRVPVNPVNP
jgi:thiol:disulfide interchange protein DsbD